MPTLLLEIGTEELPAGYIGPALSWLNDQLAARLEELRLGASGLKTYGTPRRLAVIASEIPDRQPDVSRTVTGPPAAKGFDAQGNPTKAALGFAKGQGLDPADLTVIATPKGEYVGAVKKEAGRPAAEVLGEILPEMIGRVPFAKTMRWHDYAVKFARPVRWLLCLLDTQIVPLTWGPLTAGNVTFGHRFHAPAPLVVSSPDQYLDVLYRAEVIADPGERRARVERGVAEAARAAGGAIWPDPDLVDEVTNLVELPAAVTGRFDDHFLKIPDAVVITAMREHQRYFAVVDDDGKLLPAFVAVNNTRVRDEKIAAAGHERVLRARLADAEFFFNEDMKVGLEAYAARLGEVVFHSKLGTSAKKVERFAALAESMARGLDLDPEAVKNVRRAATLCKADLVSHMVGEFPSLQGVVGGAYAELSGEDAEVARAIAEHYRPVQAGDDLPATTAGLLISLADKLDSIAGFFAVGIVPSGKADPFALRRQAIGVLRMLRENHPPDLSLSDLVNQAVAGVADLAEQSPEQVAGEVMAFFRGRLDRMLVEAGRDPGVVEAVLQAGFDRLPQAVARVEALDRLLDDEAARPLFIGLKRAFNILKDQDPPDKIDPALFEMKEENTLCDAAGQLKERMQNVELADAREITEYILAMGDLRGPIDDYFDEVMVMVEDEALRNNRLATMNAVADLFRPLADFSKLTIK
jgi:glycyl-tRNA synthetase beta chain